MPDDRRYIHLSSVDMVATIPQHKDFQEAPGETEADAVRDAFLQNAGPAPASVATALTSADGSTQARVVSRLQQTRGNAYVQRVVAAARGIPGGLVGRTQPEMVGTVESRKGAGAPLPPDTRSTMEGFFGADLGQVRVHTDTAAVQLNRELNAQAFTVGPDVFFAEGTYNPTSRAGQGLLAHELTHVAQQTGFAGPAAQRSEAVQRQGDEEEEPLANLPSPVEEEELEGA